MFSPYITFNEDTTYSMAVLNKFAALPKPLQI